MLIRLCQEIFLFKDESFKRITYLRISEAHTKENHDGNSQRMTLNVPFVKRRKCKRKNNVDDVNLVSYYLL